MAQKPSQQLRSQHFRCWPHCLAGADRLTAQIWRSGDPASACHYQFNIFRQERNGQVSQLFEPCDLVALVKLVSVLTEVLLDDCCSSAPEREQLKRVRAELDALMRDSDLFLTSGETERTAPQQEL